MYKLQVPCGVCENACLYVGAMDFSKKCIQINVMIDIDWSQYCN